jgi:hypothetical protein
MRGNQLLQHQLETCSCQATYIKTYKYVRPFFIFLSGLPKLLTKVKCDVSTSPQCISVSAIEGKMLLEYQYEYISNMYAV